MLIIIEVISVFFVLLVLHELGHVIAALAFKSSIVGFGLRWTPIPHPYVKVAFIYDRTKALVFYLAGICMTFFSFAAVSLLQIDRITIYWSLGLLSIIETNPLFSDIVLYQKEFGTMDTNKFQTIHTILWIFWILLICKVLPTLDLVVISP